MRFLFVGRFSEIGGSALATLPLIQALDQAGHTVQLLHWVAPKNTDLFNENLLNLDLAKQNNIFKKLYKLIYLASQYDIIISISEMTPTYACQIVGWLTKRPVYGEIQVHIDSWIVDNCHPLHHQLVRWFYPHLSGLRCVSQALADYSIKSLKVPAHKTFVVYNSFDLDKVQKLSNENLPVNVEKWFQFPIILCVGRLVEQKRFDLAIKALVIAQKSLVTKAHLVIVGEGHLYEDLQNLIYELNVQEFVHLIGLYRNPFPFFKKAKLFLLSSDYEGFGRVLVEAMICGCPVIAHDCPVGPREVLENGKSGILVPSNQPEVMAKAIIRTLNNTSVREQFIQRGYDRSKAFQQENLCNQYILNLRERIPKLLENLSSSSE